MGRAVAAIALATLLAGCGSPAPATAPAATPEAPGYVTKAEYGGAWPFSAPAGTLACYDEAAAGGNGRVLVTFSTGNGIEYGLNGSAIDFGFPDLDAKMLPTYPDKAGIADLIQRGLALC